MYSLTTKIPLYQKFYPICRVDQPLRQTIRKKIFCSSSRKHLRVRFKYIHDEMATITNGFKHANLINLSRYILARSVYNTSECLYTYI